ncbi:hypothetical protein [Limnohabitans sp. 2KL-3]|uniref:hypothetical protein n=1 Tax=Limnohabitans sp. 2KL-3 TaxID=1100700 RepID=UPI000B1D12DA|nr:hypothetical protein [Limnohabitans sp. 2KL-3]
MINISQFSASDIMTVHVLDQGRAGVPFWNWRISAVARKNRPGDPSAFMGAGLYAMCFDGLVIYAGSFAGSDKGTQLPVWQSGDIIPGRWTRHVGSITGRCNLLSTTASTITQLVNAHSNDHPMVTALVNGSVLKHKDAGCQGSFNRLNFAAQNWADFCKADPIAMLKRISFVYARIEVGDNAALQQLNKDGIRDLVKEAESLLIRTYKPLINGEISIGEHLEPFTCEQAGTILVNVLMKSVQDFIGKKSEEYASMQIGEQFIGIEKPYITATEGTHPMKKTIQTTGHKTVSDAQVLIFSEAKFQESLPFSGAFEVFDLDQCFERKEDGRLMAIVNGTIEGIPLTEDSTLEIELVGHYEGIVGFAGDVITSISVTASS